MRLTSRAAGLLALAAAAITCTDAPTGPGHRAGFSSAALALAPSFSPAAVQAYGALEAMGIAVTQVRIRLRAADGTLARDTTIQFGAADTLHLQLAVEIQGTEQTFSALIELLDATGIVLFSQAQDVIARASTLPAAPPLTITLDYVGPGATARSLNIAPTDLTVQPGVEPVLTAVGKDAAGNDVTNLLLAWTSSDPTIATITAIGRVATVHGTGRRGGVTVTATLPTGVAGTARLTMIPVPVRLVVVSGASQTDMAGRTLAQPLVVEVQDVDGTPIAGASVTFRALTAGSVGAATAVTDAAGRASTALTLGRVTGSQIFEAAVGTLVPVSVDMTATPIQAVALAVVKGSGQVDSTGAVGPGLVARATDEFGAPVAGVSILWERLAGTGLLGATSSVTDTDGLAGAAYVFGPLAGTDTLRATIAGATAASATVLYTATAITRGPSAIAITSGGGQVGLPGAALPLPLVALVTDALGHRLAGLTVQWQSSVPGLVTFAAPAAPTDANGEARTAATLGTAAGVGTITASVGSLGASTAIRVSIGAAANLTPVAGSGPGIVGGSSLLRVRVTDAAGNPVPGHVVSWAVTGGGGSLPFTTSTTNALGEAEITWTLGFLVGQQTVTATSSGLAGSPALFTVDAVAGSASLLRLATQPGAPAYNAPSGVVLASQPVIQLSDASGNPVRQAGVVVTASTSNAASTLRGVATATTDSTGAASFTGLDILGVSGQSTALVFAAPGFTSVTSNPLSIGPGLPATIAAQDLPTGGTVGLPVALPPAVVVRDSSGNPVSGVRVTFAVTGGGGSIAAPDATTDAGGVARVGSWVLGTVAGTNVVTATSGTLNGSPVTFAVLAQAGQPVSMEFLSSPANSVVGATLSPVRVALLDAYRNPSSSSDAVSLTLDPLGIAPGGKSTVGAVAGVATFSDLFVVGTSGTLKLKAASGQLPAAFSAAFVIDLPLQVGRIRPLANRNQLVPVRGVLPKDSVAFVVEDGNAKPLGGVLVSFRITTLSGCGLEQLTPVITGADGVASTAVTAGDKPGACEVTAVAGDAQETTKIAVYAAGTTHVWFGGTVEVDHYYDVDSNWLTVSGGKELVPTSRDTAFVPNWETNMGPQLLADAALGALYAERSAAVDLGKFTLTTGTVSAEGARVLNGLVIAAGDARVSGEFERLDVGRVDCQGDKAALETVIVKELRVFCTADVVKQADVASSIDVAARAVLTVTGALVAKSPATLRLFDAASLIVDGTASLGSCSQTVGAIIAGKGTINGLPALEFLNVCKP